MTTQVASEAVRTVRARPLSMEAQVSNFSVVQRARPRNRVQEEERRGTLAVALVLALIVIAVITLALVAGDAAPVDPSDAVLPTPI